MAYVSMIYEFGAAYGAHRAMINPDEGAFTF